MSLETQKELESAYVMHTFARKPVEFVRGQGMLLYDAEGREYLDFLSGIGVVSLGHSNPALVAALQRQDEKLLHVSNYYYVEGRGEVARTLSGLLNACVAEADRTPWKSFFTNSGAESNECAIKLARLYAKKRVEAQVRAQGGDDAAAAAAREGAPRTVVTLQKSFHGRTLATLAATAQPAKQEAFQPLPGGFVATPANDVESLERLFADRGADICAVMVECIQGESGVHPCTPEFLAKVRELTERTGALMICDEVQCGIYRCGTYPFGFQHFGVQPDIVSMAKGIGSGIPMGVCAARAQVADAFDPGDHGTTFGGSCLAVVAAACVLDRLGAEGVPERIADVGDYLQQSLAGVAGVAGVRGIGLMVACDLDEGIDAHDVVNRGLEAGLVLNATGPSTLRFLPPLVCERRHVDVLVERLAKLLS
ncbi:aminotransferase class III-fold pyridoxal phosphate-dependent enzyme [Eggerthellaceae bacterium zg-893]|nr:aminotransferase class III-fold pyridoxal phosphate-dependent enzyme [Eggerthellaceae bacterium zg-893]